MCVQHCPVELERGKSLEISVSGARKKITYVTCYEKRDRSGYFIIFAFLRVYDRMAQTRVQYLSRVIRV